LKAKLVAIPARSFRGFQRGWRVLSGLPCANNHLVLFA
jgi:hypothetical protein